MPDLQTCRICGDSNYERTGHKYGLVRYSVRSSVHYDCGLKRWGVAFFGKLRLDQLRQFPFMAAVDAGLMDQLKAAAYPDGEPCHPDCESGKHKKDCPFMIASKVADARESAARDTTLPPETRCTVYVPSLERKPGCCHNCGLPKAAHVSAEPETPFDQEKTI